VVGVVVRAVRCHHESALDSGYRIGKTASRRRNHSEQEMRVRMPRLTRENLEARRARTRQIGGIESFLSLAMPTLDLYRHRADRTLR
jgi:hypothetical protein